MLVQHTEVLPPRRQVEQGHLEHGQVAFAVLNLSVDVIEPVDVRLHAFGIEDRTWTTAYDAESQPESVGVLERHHRRHRRVLVLLGLLGGRDRLGEPAHPAGIVVSKAVAKP